VDETKVSESAFKEPISADLPRRQFDRKLLESHDSTQERIRNISSRVTRIEAIFESVNKDLRRLEEMQKEAVGHLETTAANMREISHKLALHTEMEEYQWTVVNSANDTLVKIGAALNDHLQSAGALNTRIDWIERLLWALWGVVGAMSAAAIPLVMKGLGV
jgi:chromosome segregation ATPase